jgi:hypothetical protein
MSRKLMAGLAGAALVAAACASIPEPKGEVANADLALQKSEAVNAAQFAPLDARLAREKLEKAKLAMQKEDYEKARRLAEEAEVDALVAEAKARSTRVQQNTQDLRKQVEDMRSRTGSSAEGAK